MRADPDERLEIEIANLFGDIVVPDWIFPAVASSILTLVVTLLVIIVRNRRALLTYHVTHSRIGMSTSDNIHGEISVTVGGNKMQNLYLSNVWLVNRSMSDLENLEVKVFTGTENMQIMSEQTVVEGTIEVVNYSEDYEEIKRKIQDNVARIEHANSIGDENLANQLIMENSKYWPTWFGQRWYQIPVFARNQTIRFTYTTNVFPDNEPAILVSSQNAGVRIKYKQPYQPIWHLWGIPLADAALSGIIIGVLIWYAIINSISTLWIASLVCLLIGFLGSALGAALIKLYKFIRNRLIG